MTTVSVDFNSRGTACDGTTPCVVSYARRVTGPIKIGDTVLAVDEPEGMTVQCRVVQMYPNGRLYLQPDNDTWTHPEEKP